MRFPTKMISVPANKGFCRPQIWMHCMFWFLSMLTWSWTWTNEDLWGLRSGSTHTWIFSLHHKQMLVVVAKYDDLEQATPRSFLSSSNPMGCWTTREERRWSLSIKLHCSKINISWFFSKPQNFGNVGHYWRVHSDHTHKMFLENRGTKWKKHKQKQTKSKEGQSKYTSSCVLIPYWLPKEFPFWSI
jgi:hypothetical protein